MVTSFPQMPGLINGAFFLFDGSAKVLLGFVPLIFLTRIMLAKIMFRGAIHYGQLVQDLLLVYVGFFFFEDLIRFVLEIPSYAGDIVGEGNPKELVSLKKGPDSIWIWLGIGGKALFDLFSAGLFWIMNFIYLLFMTMFIAIGAYVIFFSSMFRVRWLFSIFLILLVTISIWPFIWYMVDQLTLKVVDHLDKVGSELGLAAALFGGGLIKLGVPLLGFLYSMKNPVGIVSNAINGVKQGFYGLKNAGKSAVKYPYKAGIGIPAKVTGLDQVAKAHIKPRAQKALDLASSPFKKAHELSSSAAPAAVYGIKKALKHKSLAYEDEAGNSKVKSFSEHKEQMNQRIEIQNLERSQKRMRKTPSNNSGQRTKGFSNKHEQQVVSAKNKLNSVRGIQGVKAERKGSYVWAQSSSSKTDRILEERGFSYSKKKNMWFHTETHQRNNTIKYNEKRTSFQRQRGM